MKTTFTIIIVILSITTYLFVNQPQSKQCTTEVVVLHDITEKNLAGPNADELTGLFNLSANAWNGSSFSFENITDVSYNPVNETRISAQNEWLSNELERTKEIKDFKNKVSQIIADSEKGNIGKRKSSIFVPFVQKLNQLSQSKSEKRVLIIYSDLMENTKDISFYHKKTMNLLKTNPDSILKQFEAIQPISNLQGIQVYFIFQPANSESDFEYNTVSSFYKKLLEDKGAKVTIAANLNF